MTQHRATEEQWASVIYWSKKDEGGSDCLLELRDRVLCQEACIKDLYEQLDGLKQRLDGHFIRIKELEDNPISKPTPNDLQIRSSLVERVAYAITGDSDGPINWKCEARAAIRVVAEWLNESGEPSARAWSQVLVGEAESGMGW